ncbi:MAG: histone H1 [Bacteroidota bacterium]
MAKAKRPTDINQRAKSIVDIATGDIEDTITPQDELKKAAAALGRKGGLKGGNARAASLTPERRAEIAKKAAEKRWGR